MALMASGIVFEAPPASRFRRACRFWLLVASYAIGRFMISATLPYAVPVKS
jgi:hypothetical protein